MRPMVRRLLPAAIVAVLLAGAAGYLSLKSSPTGGDAPSFRAGSLTIGEPFSLATLPEAKTAAGYMTIDNKAGESDRLLSATVEVAGGVAIEETTVVDGVTEVRVLDDGLEVPAGGSIHLVPGSYRLLFGDLNRQLKEGEGFSGTLTFANAGSVDVTYEVGPYVASVGAEPFALIDQDGRPFESADLAGSPYAIFFGYTHCPDVCPTTLFEMSEALKALGTDADRLKVVFVSVDPERDTPELLKSYLSSFDARILGLTGSAEGVDAAAKSFRIFYRKVPGEDGDYSMDHSASVLLMDATGRFVGAIGYDEDSRMRLAKLRRLLAS